MQVLVDGNTVAALDRNKGVKVSLPMLNTDESQKEVLCLDILVEGLGRDNSGSKFDLKGLISQDVYLNGRLLTVAEMVMTFVTSQVWQAAQHCLDKYAIWYANLHSNQQSNNTCFKFLLLLLVSKL